MTRWPWQRDLQDLAVLYRAFCTAWLCASDPGWLGVRCLDYARIYLARYEDEAAVCLDIEDVSGRKTLVFVHEG
jgi:hypothetical protein